MLTPAASAQKSRPCVAVAHDASTRGRVANRPAARRPARRAVTSCSVGHVADINAAMHADSRAVRAGELGGLFGEGWAWEV